MKSWIFCSLIFISLSATAQDIPLKESDIKITTKQWTTVTASEVAVINTELSLITTDTPRSKIEEMLQKALEQVQMVRVKLTGTGVAIEGFTINVALPPSVEIKFKFEDK